MDLTCGFSDASRPGACGSVNSGASFVRSYRVRDWLTCWWASGAVGGLCTAVSLAVALTAGCQAGDPAAGPSPLTFLAPSNPPNETPKDMPTMPGTALLGEPTPVAPPRQVQIVLTVLHVQVPQEHRAQAEPLWNYVHEDVVDYATRQRLRDNGVRVGVGHAQWWEAVKAVLDGIADVRSNALAPVRLPEDYPLALELDSEPQDRTIFFVSDDGILTGETWPASRVVLRLSCAVRLDQPDRLRLTAVPEVRQRLEGFRWVRSAGGLSQEPRFSGRTLPTAGFVVDLGPGEFLLVAPGEQAGLFGIPGGVLLVRTEDGQRRDSLIFVQAELRELAAVMGGPAPRRPK